LCLRGGARTIDGMRGRGKPVAICVGALGLAVLATATWFSWPHLRFWWLFEPLGPNAQGFPEYRHRQTGIVFVSLPGGKFWMGAQKMDPKGQNYDPEAQPNEGPVHEVTLSPFLIAKHEVTQGQWQRVMGTIPSQFEGADLPAESVCWEECREFCRRAGLEFPTEAQWEYACRGGTSACYAETVKLEDMAWFVENSRDTTHPVGQKAGNGFGLHDMHGNVWEWCEDAFNEGFYRTPEAAELDPVFTSGSDDRRVLRGGAFYLHRVSLRCASRCELPYSRAHFIGFRVVASPPP